MLGDKNYRGNNENKINKTKKRYVKRFNEPRKNDKEGKGCPDNIYQELS